jgi:hypothetical protein
MVPFLRRLQRSLARRGGDQLWASVAGSLRAQRECAKAGADDLLSITAEDGWIYHNNQARDLDYSSWCHGPPGTSRLFSLLHEITGDARYRTYTQGAAGIGLAFLHDAVRPGASCSPTLPTLASGGGRAADSVG